MIDKPKETILFNSVPMYGQKNKKTILKEVSSVVDRGIFLNGPQVLKLEESLSAIFRQAAITVASGHDALLLSLRALHLRRDDEVIFPANSYPTAFPIAMSGGTAVACDVDINGQLDAEILEKTITRNTKAIVVVHLYGLVGRLDRVIDLVKKYKITLIEDCAQAFGSKFKNQYVGTFGDFGCFSFYPTKNLGTFGDGGAIFAKKKQHIDFIRKARQYGESTRYHSQFISGHSRLSEFQASILNLRLKEFAKVVDAKKRIYNYYQKSISAAGLQNNVRLLEMISGKSGKL